MRKKSALRLFLSVDVVGSTAFKNQEHRSSPVPPWYEFFRDFYQEFPEFLSAAYGSLSSGNGNGPHGAFPCLWKSIGDELIFSTELVCHIDALYHVNAFQLAIKQYRKKTADKKLPLSFKGCAWVAGFPIINVEIPLTAESEQYDYIGPQIDGGFRLSQQADARRFTISVELALLLSRALQDEPNHFNSQFYFDGKRTLKGVLGGKPYPILWIDMESGCDFEDEDQLGNLRHSVSYAKLEAYCRRFLQDSPAPIVIPYMEKCDVFGDIDQSHQELLEKLSSDPQELLGDRAEEPSELSAEATLILEAPKLKAKTS